MAFYIKLSLLKAFSNCGKNHYQRSMQMLKFNHTNSFQCNLGNSSKQRIASFRTYPEQFLLDKKMSIFSYLMLTSAFKCIQIRSIEMIHGWSSGEILTDLYLYLHSSFQISKKTDIKLYQTNHEYIILIIYVFNSSIYSYFILQSRI